MRFPPLLIVWLILSALGLLQDSAAQTFQLDLRDTPLPEALALYSGQTGIDLVFAQRLVEGRIATCQYTGDDPAAALACLLQDTGLQAEAVSRRQYVLVATPAQPPVKTLLPIRTTLAGFVVDEETGEVLPGAHVYLPGRRVGTVTNEAGYFALPALQGALHLLQVSYVGYSTVDILLDAGTRPTTIRLTPKAVFSAGVIIEEDRDERSDLTVMPGVVTTPVQELEQFPISLGGQDLFQALMWTPGVQRSGEVRGGLVVRGGGPDQNLYLLDGAPIYHPWHAFSLISTFQTETFKEIKLYRGAFPAEHGSRLTSVLDAELKDGSRAGPRVVNAVNVLNGRFLIESPITPTSSFMLSGRSSYLDKLIGREHAVADDLGRRDTLRTGYYFYDWSAKLTFRSGTRSRLSFSYYNGRDDLDLRLPFDVSLDFASWLRPADLFFEVDQRWGNQLYSVRYQYLYSRRVFLTVAAYQSSYGAREGAFIQPTSTASVTSDYRVRLDDLGLKIDVDYYLSLAHQIRAGVQVVDHRFQSSLDALLERSPGVVEAVDERSRLRALEMVGYVQDSWQPSPRWKVQPGVRASFFSGGRYLRLSPRLSVQYAVHPEWLVVRAAAGTQVQYLQQLRDRYSYLFDLVSSRWVPAGDQVHPSRSGQVSLGVESRPKANFSLTADLYVRGARNVLIPRDAFQTKDGLESPGIDVGTLLGQYTTGFERAYGLELGAHLVQGPWQTWLSYAGARSLNRAEDLEEPHYSPTRFDVPRAFTGIVQRSGARWQVTLATILRSGYPETVPVARYSIGGPLDDTPVNYLYRPDINNGRLSPYFRVDATVGYRFEWIGAQWTAQLQVYNLTNRRNVVGRYYDPAQPIVTANERRGLPLLPLFELEMEL